MGPQMDHTVDGINEDTPKGKIWKICRKLYKDHSKHICRNTQEYVRNIHKYLWYKVIRNTGAAFGGRPIGSVFLIILYHKCLWEPKGYPYTPPGPPKKKQHPAQISMYTARRPNPAEPARPPESGRTRPSVRIRPNSDWGRPSESGRTQIWDGRPNPAELRLGTTARIQPNSDWGQPPESGRKNIFLIVNDLLYLKT